MKTGPIVLTILIALLTLQASTYAQQPKGSPCTGPNGSRFNLEPRPNAVVQVAQSVAVLADGGVGGNELVLATAIDVRAIVGVAFDAFYVQRSTSNCTPDLEGELPIIQNTIDPQWIPNGTPIAVSDPVRNAFFITGIRFGLSTDDSGVGILRATASTLSDTTNCPDGTQNNGSAGCFAAASVFNIVPLNTFLSSPHIAVDQRTKGTGAGDVYTVVTQSDHIAETVVVSLMACTNATLDCSNPGAVKLGPPQAVTQFPIPSITALFLSAVRQRFLHGREGAGQRCVRQEPSLHVVRFRISGRDL